MTTHAWFNCSAGVAGDMVLASLVDAGADPIAVGAMLAGLGLDDYALTFEPTQRAGVRSTRAIVAVHEHDDHHHRAWRDIRALLERADLPERVRARSLAVFALLAEVEAKIHGVDVDDVEFHEVGAVDSIVDIVGACAALEVLGIDTVSCGPVGTGHGTVRTQHGELPNPAPATVSLAAMRQIPLAGLDDRRELATPTGVALMAALADSFGALPSLVVSGRGYGAGALDVNGRANVVQVVVGEVAGSSGGPGQAVRLLEVNVDDVTGEVIAHTIGALLEAGAHDAWATPIVMKKGRPAHTVHALCDPALTETISRVLVSETGSLGVRGSMIQRWPQARRDAVVRVEGHEIRVKVAGDRVKVEHDDAARAAVALGLPLREVLIRAEIAALG
ncbi:MAG: nickel pincer cofactor biosynthesis protein LarC [Actinobacteria bacterium]|nr:nickel pincer cofactor biosynthesis protein LarC [Actinomycetota bacterium]